MNLKSKTILQELKENRTQLLDLTLGHDEPNHIANRISRKCQHPIYYCHGFFKAPNSFKNEIEPKMTTKADCDYCLLQCLECGSFKAIDKCRKEGFVVPKSLIIISPNAFEEVREEYLDICLIRSEHQIVKKFRKEYATKL